jgi:hypothetical protein
MTSRKSDLDPEALKRIERSLYAATDFTPEREMPADLIERAFRQKQTCRAILPRRRLALAAGLALTALILAAAFRWQSSERVQMAGHHSMPPAAAKSSTQNYLLPEPFASNAENISPVKKSVQSVPPPPERENANRKRSTVKSVPRREMRRKVRPVVPYRPQRMYAAHREQSIQPVRWREEVVKVPQPRVLAPGWILQPDPQQQAVYITPVVAEFPLSSE